MAKWIVIGMFVASAAHADIVCRVQTAMGPAKIEIAANSVTVSGAALTKPQVYSSLNYQWDSHQTELITAPGLSISYQDWYGCIHNARITANFRDASLGGAGYIDSVMTDQCSGGSTSDKVCHVGTGN